jgi:hypothetical protein
MQSAALLPQSAPVYCDAAEHSTYVIELQSEQHRELTILLYRVAAMAVALLLALQQQQLCNARCVY